MTISWVAADVRIGGRVVIAEGGRRFEVRYWEGFRWSDSELGERGGGRFGGAAFGCGKTRVCGV